MFVEYLFEINPLTLLLIVITAIIFVSKFLQKSKKNSMKDIKDPIINEYETISEVKSQDQTFLVMSYNIMAYNFSKYNWYSYCNPEFLHPKYRAPKILNEIKSVDPDIICLQECDHDLFLEFYKVNLEALGYTTLLKITSVNKIVSIITAYKDSKFKMEKFEHLNLNDDLENLDDSFQKHKEALLSTLRHIQTGKQILVCNTHLFWNPDYEYIKYGQTSKILKYIEKNYNDLPTIFAGDFNSLPSSNVLRYIYRLQPIINSNVLGDYNINKKYMEYFYTNSMHTIQLKSAYENYRVDDKSKSKDKDDFENISRTHPDFTSYTEDFNGCLDYIFYNSNKLKVTQLLKIPTSEAEIKSLKLPNHKYPSDHLKIASRFCFSS